MNLKTLVIPTTIMFMVSCGGGTTTSSSSSGQSNSSSSSSGITSSSSSGIVSTSSSSSSGGFTIPPSPPGNIQNGQVIMESQQCALCHADTGSAAQGIYGGIAPFNVNSFTYQNDPNYAGHSASNVDGLAYFITEAMPSNAPNACDTQCGADIAAYLWSLRGSNVVIVEESCESNDPVYYGQRGLKLLTSYEYHNSLQALFKQDLPDDFSSPARASVDSNIARLPNQKNTVVSESRQDQYDQNALAIAEWAMSNESALPFVCNDYSSDTCADNFINNFATRAFRRPLTQAEKSDLRTIITNGFTPQKGMEWAIRAVLGSAHFLYRSEVGMRVSDVKANGWGIGTADFGGPTKIVDYAKIEAESFFAMNGIQLENTEDQGGGQNVGYIDTGDWLDYEINVANAGDYQISYRVASEIGGGRITLRDGGNLGSLDVPTTGAWQSWQTVSHNVSLNAGSQTLRLEATTGGFNLNWIEIAAPGASGGGSSNPVGDAIKVEAENFSAQNGTQTEPTEDVGGGDNVGYIDTGDFLEYNVNLPQDGRYQISYRIASQDGGGVLELAGAGNIDVPATGAWQNWETITQDADLSSGNNNIRINIVNGGFNINWIEFALTDAPPASNPEETNNFVQLHLAENSAYVLDPYEYASALSYMYTASPPDTELLTAARDGELDDISVVEEHIERMINSELGREQVKRFIAKWLKTDGVMAVSRNHPDFNSQVKQSMAEEVRRVYEHIVYNGRPFSEIYDANYTFLDSTLSDFYGIPGGGSQHGQFNQVATSERGGILTTGAFMAFYSHTDETAPIIRSVNVRQNMLCQEVPPPPELGEAGSDRDANLAEVQRKEAEGTLTTTERYDLLTKAEGCGGCHNGIINPLFGMDDFDFVGLPRDRVNGEVVQKGLGPVGQSNVPIDWVNRGVVYGINSINDVALEVSTGGGLHFSGAKDLSQKMAYQPSVESCFIKRTYRYATGYPLNDSADTEADRDYSTQQKAHAVCVTENLKADFENSSKSPYELYKAIGLTDVIRFRKD